MATRIIDADGATIPSLEAFVAAAAPSPDLSTVLGVGNTLGAEDIVIDSTGSIRNLASADAVCYLRKGAAARDEGAYAVRRGTGELDAVVAWNDGAGRWELGYHDTTGGTVAPPGALSSLADVRFNDIYMTGNSINGTAAVRLRASGSVNLEGTALEIWSGGSQRWFVNSSGHFFADADNLLDVGSPDGGSTDKRPRTVYVGTSMVVGSGVTIDTNGFSKVATTDNVILLRQGASSGDEAVITVERGADGDDAVMALVTQGLLSPRWEAGFFDTVGGTTAPTGTLANLADFRCENLTIAGGFISGDSGVAMTVRSNTADLNVGTINGGDLVLQAATGQWKVKHSTGHIVAASDNARDIGSADGGTTPLRPRTIYVGTSFDGPAVDSSGALAIGGTAATSVTIGRSGQSIGLFGASAVTQPANIVSLTDSSGGSANDTIAAITNAANAGSADVGPTADAIADLAAKVNAILTLLNSVGLMA